MLGSTQAETPAPNTLMNCLPEELRDNMSDMSLYTDNYHWGIDRADSVTLTWDYLPLLSAYEYGFDSPTYANPVEASKQTRPQYYVLGNNTQKVYQHNKLDTLAQCWTRTLSYYVSGARQFWYLFNSNTNTNNLSFSYASDIKCVSPIFRIS